MATRKTTKSTARNSGGGNKKNGKKALSQLAKISILLFGIGIFLLALTFIEGASVWTFLRQNILFGVFGASAYFLAPFILYIATVMALGKNFISKIIKCSVVIIVVSAAFLIFSDIDINSYTFTSGIQHLFTVSSNGWGIGPGVLGAVIGWPLLLLFARPAANIVFVIAIIVIAMIIFAITPAEIFNFTANNAKRMKNSIDYIDKTNKNRIEQRNLKMQEQAQQRKAKQEELQLKKQEQFEQRQVLENSQHHENANSEVMNIVNSKTTFGESALSQSTQNNASKANIDIDISPVPSVTLNVLTEDEVYIGPGGTFGIDPNATPTSQERAGYMKDDYEFGSIISYTAPKTQTNSALPNASEPKASEYVVGDTLELMAQKAINNAKDEMVSDMQIMGNVQIGKYVFPPLKLFQKQPKSNDDNIHAELTYKGDLLVKTLASFGVQTKILDISRGPSVTRYELQPLAGVKISRITGLSDDIALNLATMGVRIEAPIPGKAAVGIEIPNEKRTAVNFRSILEDRHYTQKTEPLTFAVGKDIAGQVIVGNLAKMPHLLIAGTTGSGKSVCTNAIIMSFLYRCAPETMRLILIDPKMVEFAQYNGIPHLLMPVVTEPRKAAGALGSAVAEMEKRYLLLAQNGVPNIEEYNLLAQENDELEKLPYIVIVIDELADLMMVASKEVEEYICRIAQKARAAGMHLIIATQRPSVDVITGLIKANIPSRIGLSVMSQIDSRTILDMGGAEKLLGNGDMLYMPVGTNKPVRVQGAYIQSSEIRSVIDFLKNNSDSDYNEDMIADMEKRAVETKGTAGTRDDDDSEDPMFKTAVEVILDAGQASTSLLQRRCKLGYARAARIMDEIEQAGIIGPSEGAKPRQILISRQQWIEMSMNKEDNP